MRLRHALRYACMCILDLLNIHLQITHGQYSFMVSQLLITFFGRHLVCPVLVLLCREIAASVKSDNQY